jgi:hypothetical protein
VSPEDEAARISGLEADRDRPVELVRHLTAAVELLAELAGAQVSAEAPPRRRRSGGREIQAPARPTPVVCLFCFQVIADESDADLLKRLQAHSCPEGEQQ